MSDRKTIVARGQKVRSFARATDSLAGAACLYSWPLASLTCGRRVLVFVPLAGPLAGASSLYFHVVFATAQLQDARASVSSWNGCSSFAPVTSTDAFDFDRRDQRGIAPAPSRAYPERGIAHFQTCFGPKDSFAGAGERWYVGIVRVMLTRGLPPQQPPEAWARQSQALRGTTCLEPVWLPPRPVRCTWGMFARF